jgi:hypothetical protein
MSYQSTTITLSFRHRHLPFNCQFIDVRWWTSAGGFATVFLAETGTGEQFALKRILAPDQEAAASCRREIKVMRQFQSSPYIVQLHAADERSVTYLTLAYQK